MAKQMIEVRLINPANQDVWCDEFTVASSHRESIDLAMHHFSHGIGIIKSIEKQGDAEWVKAGTNSCWLHRYSCIVEDDEYDRAIVALLFAQYKEDYGMRKV